MTYQCNNTHCRVYIGAIADFGLTTINLVIPTLHYFEHADYILIFKSNSNRHKKLLIILDVGYTICDILFCNANIDVTL